ncbi:hypothetical protein DFJ43DRAFT_1044713 [Lentinula guzmanii]|uniref:Uncharacterized protein n=1 Tax=Lentinula guzmanii TaxID=2804957 RepID=A0AA38J1E6_9AGAR|nr:hypothetical protein DFJ43DRAFT_1044713 [Lentinula guzmanii]
MIFGQFFILYSRNFVVHWMSSMSLCIVKIKLQTYHMVIIVQYSHTITPGSAHSWIDPAPGSAILGLTQLPGQPILGLTQLPGQPILGLTQLPGQPILGLTQLPGQPILGLTQLLGQPILGLTQLPGQTSIQVAEKEDGEEDEDEDEDEDEGGDEDEDEKEGNIECEEKVERDENVGEVEVNAERALQLEKAEEDIGLNDDDDEGPPPWLSSERVRKGIKGILLRDRSDEELRRLRHEMRAMREWMREEWELLLRAIDGVKASGDLSIHYQLLERKDALLRLCITWSQSLSAVSFFSNGTLPPWGPSDKELESAAAGMASEIVVEVEGNIGNEVGGDYISSDEEESQLDEEEFDVGLLEQMDTLQVGDEEDI